MGRPIHRLTVKEVESFREPGVYADGGGLYLRVSGAHGRSWLAAFHLAGRRREIGLGGFPDVGLAEARRAAEEVRRVVRLGRDPVAERRAQRETAASKNEPGPPRIAD